MAKRFHLKFVEAGIEIRDAHARKCIWPVALWKQLVRLMRIKSVAIEQPEWDVSEKSEDRWRLWHNGCLHYVDFECDGQGGRYMQLGVCAEEKKNCKRVRIEESSMSVYRTKGVLRRFMERVEKLLAEHVVSPVQLVRLGPFRRK